MASRFHQRDNNRSSLFSSYDAQTRPRPSSASPNPSKPSSGYGYNIPPAPSGPGAFSAYPSNGHLQSQTYNGAPPERSRSATSFEKKGYNTAVLDELESQNDGQVSEMSKRVAMLKDITMKIGDEIRDSTALAEKMNDNFGSAGLKLKGTMNRMLRMAERTGVGWRVWLGFFAFIIVLFWYVWLF